MANLFVFATTRRYSNTIDIDELLFKFSHFGKLARLALRQSHADLLMYKALPKIIKQ